MILSLRSTLLKGLCALAFCSTIGLAQQMEQPQVEALEQATPETNAAPRPFPLAAGPKVYLADANGKLGTLDLGNGAVKIIGSTGVFMTDVAFCPGNVLYGIFGYRKLYRINPNTAQKTLVGDTGVQLNALVCSSSGTLLSMGPSGTNLYRVDKNTGKATSIGNTGYKSAGDLAFYNGSLLLTSMDNKLVWLNPANGAPQKVYNHGIRDLWGLVTIGSNVYGFALNKAYWFTNNGILYFDFSGKGFAKITGATYK